MRYRLRSLLILMALGPPLLSWGCFAWKSAIEEARRRELAAATQPIKVQVDQVATELQADLDLPFYQGDFGSLPTDVPLLPRYQSQR